MSRKEFVRWFASSIAAVFIIQCCSWLSYSWPEWKGVMTLVVLAIVFVASCYKLILGLGAVLLELTIGSQGHLLDVQVGPLPVSLRLGLFLTVVLATAIWILRERRVYFFDTHYWKWYVALVTTCVIAAVTAVLHNNSLSNTFLDANGYLFLGMIIPFTQAVRTKLDVYQLLVVMAGGLSWLVLATLVIAFLFAHPELFVNYLSDLYRWLRDFRIVEITVTDYVRIFFQSHLYVLFGFILSSVAFIRGYQVRWMAVLISIFSTVLIILSYSRSFWVALLIMVMTLMYLAKRTWWKYLGVVVFGSGLGCLLVLGVVNLKFGEFAQVLSDRTTSIGTDAATSSRTALLVPLTKAALVHPLLGSGFGTTVTYCTKDQRIASASDCAPYTTFAFEWGFLDLWLKFGAVFAIAWVVIVTALVVYVWRSSTSIIPQAAALGIVAVMVIHAFTPYLNHPLGIGWIVFASAIGTVYARQR